MDIIFDIIIIVFSAILHEISHGLAARALGDKTAEYAGRLTLNPMAHIDPYGSVIMPLFLWFVSGGRFLFAYAKPVPFNPYNLRNQKWGPALVGLAGPATNFAIAIVLAGIIRLDLFSFGIAEFLVRVLLINLSLGVFNLLPIPPLDGSRLMYVFLPRRLERYKAMFEQYGMWVALLFVFFFSYLLMYPIEWIARILIG
jgi:Zn-dependent protease